MAHLTMVEIARIAAGAGFSGADLPIAAAVTQPESGGNSEKRNLNSREDSRGLWQINTFAHPEFNNSNLYDPAVNASAAYAVFKKQGWNAWTGYTSGAYLMYLPAAKSAASQVQTTTTNTATTTESYAEIQNISTIGDIAGTLKTLTALALKTGAWIADPGNWIRVGQTMVGGALIAIGLGVVAMPAIKKVQAPLKNITDLATTAVPQAKAAKVATSAKAAKSAKATKAAPKKAPKGE